MNDFSKQEKPRFLVFAVISLLSVARGMVRAGDMRHDRNNTYRRFGMDGSDPADRMRGSVKRSAEI